MRLIVLVAVVMWQGSALADPAAASGKPCTVSIVAAPEEVRAEVEAWVASERRCSRTLELRIVATAAGFHVFARDDRGRVRERVVPDAQSIGALVVSWIADDAPAGALPDPEPAPDPAPPALPAPPAPPPLPAPPPPPLPAPTPTPDLPRARLARLDAAGVAAGVAAPDPRHPWLTLVGALSVSEDHKYGVRGDLDLAGRRWWSIGAFAAQVENNQSSMGISMTRAGGYLAAEAARGDWQVRAQAGLGGALYWMRNYCDCEQMGVGPRVHQFTLRPISELTVLVGHALGTRWSVAGGAVVTAAIIDYGIPAQDRVSVMMFAGFRNRL